jgi:DNA repair ATPase RecN
MRIRETLNQLNARLTSIEEAITRLRDRPAGNELAGCRYHDLASLVKTVQNDLGFRIESESDRIRNLFLQAEITDSRLARIEGLQDEIRTALRDYTGALNQILDRLPEEYAGQES